MAVTLPKTAGSRTTPFLEAVAKIPLEGAQRRTMYAIKGSIDRYLRENPSEATTEPAPAPSGKNLSWDELMQRLDKLPPEQQK